MAETKFEVPETKLEVPETKFETKFVVKEIELVGSNSKLVKHDSISDVPKITGSAPKAYIKLIVQSAVILIFMPAGFLALKSWYEKRGKVDKRVSILSSTENTLEDQTLV